MLLKMSITGGKEQELQNELNKLQYHLNVINKDAYDSLMNKKYSNDIDKQRLIKKI